MTIKRWALKGDVKGSLVVHQMSFYPDFTHLKDGSLTMSSERAYMLRVAREIFGHGMIPVSRTSANLDALSHNTGWESGNSHTDVNDRGLKLAAAASVETCRALRAPFWIFVDYGVSELTLYELFFACDVACEFNIEILAASIQGDPSPWMRDALDTQEVELLVEALKIFVGWACARATHKKSLALLQDALKRSKITPEKKIRKVSLDDIVAALDAIQNSLDAESTEPIKVWVNANSNFEQEA